jgi:hypothetical protein
MTSDLGALLKLSVRGLERCPTQALAFGVSDEGAERLAVSQAAGTEGAERLAVSQAAGTDARFIVT